MQYPVNRDCPLTAAPATRLLGYMPAGLVCRGNPTYRANALDILGLSAADEFPIVEGPTGFAFAGWLPDGEFLSRLYDETVDQGASMTGSIGYHRSNLEWSSYLIGAAERLEPHRRPLKLLDYGCGHGIMLRLMGNRDVQAIGYEPNAARNAISLENSLVFKDLDAVAEHGPFDLVVCTQVLEHLAEPLKAIRFMKRHAAPGALLAMSVPNCSRQYLSEALSGFRAGQPQPLMFNPWEHLSYFTAQEFRRVLSTEGLEVIDDFQRKYGARDALARFETQSLAAATIGGLRVLKRLLAGEATTALLCRCA